MTPYTWHRRFAWFPIVASGKLIWLRHYDHRITAFWHGKVINCQVRYPSLLK